MNLDYIRAQHYELSEPTEYACDNCGHEWEDHGPGGFCSMDECDCDGYEPRDPQQEADDAAMEKWENERWT